MDQIFTHSIIEQECVGNSVGKHNFNALSLETQICNLSSSFVDSQNNFTTGLSAVMDQLNQLSALGDLARYNKMYTTVNLLSSNWNTPEFSILYPVNISSVGNQSIVNPSINDPIDKLINLTQSYLTLNFPNNSYTLYTKINVNLFLYSAASNPFDPNNLTSTTIDKEFSFLNRNMNVVLSRQDVHFETGNILKFVNLDNRWTCVNVIGPNVSVTGTNRKKVYLNVSNSISNYNVGIQAALDGNYDPGNTDVVLNIQSGVTINSLTYTQPALTVGNLKNGDYVIIFNYGSIIGAGGDGGDGGNSAGTGNTTGSPGAKGGAAIAAFFPCTIENHGQIHGGGGGGGGGTGGLTGSTSTGGGGGGGAGSVGGLSGNRGTNAIFKSKGITIADGQPGGFSSGGTGGPGLSNDSRATGGTGGSIGTAGKSSDSASGGAAGNYILGNSNVYWAITGDVLGEMA